MSNILDDHIAERELKRFFPNHDMFQPEQDTIFFGKFKDKEGNRYDLGMFMHDASVERFDQWGNSLGKAPMISHAIVYGPNPEDYISGSLDPRRVDEDREVMLENYWRYMMHLEQKVAALTQEVAISHPLPQDDPADDLPF